MGACDSVKNDRIHNTNIKRINSLSDNSNRLNQTFSNFSSNTLYSAPLSYRQNNLNEPKWFPRGEKYYSIIKDSNTTNLIENKNTWQSEKIELFFSLINVTNPNNLYSLSVTIINNIRLQIDTYLGDLDHNSGKNIYFGNSFIVDYFYERKQKIIIKPIINNNRLNLESSFILGDLFSSPNKSLEANFTNIGILKISYIPLNKYINNKIDLSKTISNFKFNINMYNLSNNLSSNLFFVISHFKDGENRRPVYKSPENNLINFSTNVIKIESDYLCLNANDKIYIELYSYQNMPIFLAYGKFTLSQLQTKTLNNQLTEILLYNTNQENKGLVKIQYYIKNKFSFVDKLTKNKMQINLEIAIDYTKSNKPPNDPRSNHYLNGRDLNDYEKAIKACCEVLAPYDADQLFPVYGFGGIPSYLNGKPNNNNKVSHCFNINFEEDAEIHGVDNILKIYRESLNNVVLSGNTKFSFFLKKVISNINKDLKYRKSENHYYMLLILTDGVVNDLKETIDLIVEASFLPLSIIIVGIGDEDFSFMDKLDGDEVPLVNSQGVKRKRDIVQFIRFNNFKKNNAINIGNDFAEEVLKEIPTQIEEYYNEVGKFY